MVRQRVWVVAAAVLLLGACATGPQGGVSPEPGECGDWPTLARGESRADLEQNLLENTEHGRTVRRGHSGTARNPTLSVLDRRHRSLVFASVDHLPDGSWRSREIIGCQ